MNFVKSFCQEHLFVAQYYPSLLLSAQVFENCMKWLLINPPLANRCGQSLVAMPSLLTYADAREPDVSYRFHLSFSSKGV